MLSFFVGTAFAQSPKSLDSISGTIHNDTTWTNDTVLVTGEIFIPDSVCLTINPGTVVLFDANHTVFVLGSIIAQGTASDSILFSVTDTAGYASLLHTGWGGFYFDNNGPITINDSSLFSYCVFEYFYDGYSNISAFFLNGFSKLVVEKSRFSHNHSDDAACFTLQGLSNIMISNNLFTFNNGERSCIDINCNSSSAASVPIIEENVFRYNSTGTDYRSSSCLKLSGYTKAKVINNVFEYNVGYYGNILISGYSSPLLFGNLIANNIGEYGGAIKIKYYTNPSFINNTIVNNHSNTEGGAFHIGCSSIDLLFQNNIIWGNSAVDTASQIYCNDGGTLGYQFINNIIQYGFDSIYFNSTSFDGVNQNTITLSPAFVDSANHDYHITCASPALDAGNNPMMPQIPLFDIDGNHRISGVQIDLGAFELPAAFITSQPQNTVVSSGDQAIFSVTASGATAYQWETSNDLGNTWINVVDGANFSGATTNTLTINTYNSLNGHLYRCLVTSNCPSQIVGSDYAILLVNVVNVEEMQTNFSIYPNPCISNIYLENAINTEVFITDVNGKIIQHIPKVSSDKESIDLSKQSNGVYFVKIIGENNVKTLKIIKK